MTQRTKYLILSTVALIVLALDQWTKGRARDVLKPLWPRAKVIVEGYFDLRYSENTGSAFGLFRGLTGGRWILTLVASVALITIVVIARKTAPTQRRLVWALGFVAGGAVGNVLDRIVFGKVTDFIVWKVGTHEWPSFNIADSALCIGVGLMVLDSFRPQLPPATGGTEPTGPATP
jgi:signal peptidase II